MNIKLLTLILLTFTLLHSNLKSDELPRDIGIGINISNSLSVLGYGEVKEYTETQVNEFDLVTSTLGFSVDLLYKSKRKTYLNLTIEHNFLFLNDKIEFLEGEDLTANYTGLQICGIHFVNSPSVFTPYFGYGVELLFISSNQDNVYTIDRYDGDRLEVDYFGEFNMALLFKAGLQIPINDKFTVKSEIDLHFTFAEALGLVPRLNVGANYWIK